MSPPCFGDRLFPGFLFNFFFHKILLTAFSISLTIQDVKPEILKAIKEGLGAGLIFRTRELHQELQRTLFGYFEWSRASKLHSWLLRDAVRVLPDEPAMEFYAKYKQHRNHRKGTNK